MYRAWYGDTLIYNPQSDDVQILDAVVTLEENKAGTFTFTIPANHEEYDVIKRRAEVIEVRSDDTIIFRGQAIEVENDFYGNKKVRCEGELSYFNNSIQRQARYQEITVRGLLTALINNHNAQVDESQRFEVGIVTVKDSNDSIYCYSNMEPTMKCLKEDLLDDLGGIIRIRYEGGTKYIDYIQDTDTRTNTQDVRLEENLIDFTSNLDSTDVATAIIPLGAKLEESAVEGLETRLDIKSVNDDVDYVFNQDAVKSFGWIYKVVTWDDVTTPETLKKKAEAWLRSTQFDNLVLTARVVDMSLIDTAYESFKLSDHIRIISRPHGLDRYFRMTKRTYNLDSPERDEITLGKEEFVTLSARQAEIAEALKKAAESIAPKNNVLALAKENATALINGNGENGYLVLHTNDDGVPYEILIMDTPNIETARKVWRWNQAGLGYSNNGYKGPYGLAMTMDGSIVADYVTSGIMQADRIRGGSLVVGGTGTGRDGSIIGYNASGNTRLFLLDKSGAYFNGILEANTLTGGAGKQLQDAINTANEAIRIAQNAANKAQSTADTANRAAATAQSAANTANNAASVAHSAANKAQSTADTALLKVNSLEARAITTTSLSSSYIKVAGINAGAVSANSIVCDGSRLRKGYIDSKNAWVY